MADDSQEHILPGDWWFLRKAKIPEIATGNQVELLRISSTAAKLCNHRVSLQMVGVSEWLRFLARNDFDSLATRLTEQDELREKLDIGNRSQWSRIIDPNVNNWSPDFIFKLAVLRESTEPGPTILDWAAHLTWLVMCQQELDSGTIDVDAYIYAACAIELCQKIRPVTGQSKALWPEQELQLPKFDALWKRRALARCLFYTKTAYPLLSKRQLNRLESLAGREHEQFFAIAANYGAVVRSQLSDWGVLE